MSMLEQMAELLRTAREKSEAKTNTRSENMALRAALKKREEYAEELQTRVLELETRIASLEAWLVKVVDTAVGDGREATSPETQMIMRTARAVAENKLKKP